MRDEIIEQAAELAGGIGKLAEIAGVQSQAVSQWKQIPVKHVLNIEKALKHRLTRYQMRPDIYE